LSRKKAAEALRAVILSPEFLFSFAVTAAAWQFPSAFERIGTALRDAEATAAWTVVSVPALLGGVTYKLIRRLTHPENRRQELAQWPEYWRLLVRVKVSLWISAAAVVLMAASWFGVHFVSATLGGLGAVVSVLLAATTVATVAFAPLDLDSILDEAGDD
jgi:hypothetical protein